MKAETIQVGIIIENWKIRIFKKRLKQANYEFRIIHNEPSPQFKAIIVLTDNSIKLQKTIEGINAECQRADSTTH